MFYCRDCGQCSFLGDDHFYENRNTSGWERVTIDCINGETQDYEDSETSDSDHSSYECPHCGSEDICDSWEGSNEDAVGTRNAYELDQTARRREMNKLEQERMLERQAKDPNREWDVMTNV